MGTHSGGYHYPTSWFSGIRLNIELKGIGAYRTAFYIPSILGANLAVVIMWQFLFTSGGLANQLLKLFGAQPAGWYGDSAHATAIIILLRLWEFGRLYTLLVRR